MTIPPALRRRLARLLLLIARSRPGARLAALACARAPRLLPVTIVATTPDVLAFRHPRPEARDHIVLTTREYIRDLDVLLTRHREDLVVRFVEVAREIGRHQDSEERGLAINIGGRQEVRQLHAHLLTHTGLRLGLEGVLEEQAVLLSDRAALRHTLRRLAARVHEAGREPGGAVLILDLNAECPRFAATVTPGDRRQP